MAYPLRILQGAGSSSSFLLSGAPHSFSEGGSWVFFSCLFDAVEELASTTQLPRKIRRILYPFRLQQMPLFVTCNNLESHSHGEPHSRRQRVPESDPVHVLAPRPHNQFSARLIARQEPLQYCRTHSRRRPNLPRRRHLPSIRRRLHKILQEPPAHPAWPDFVHRRIRFPFQRCRHRRQIPFIRDTQMLQALPDAPRARRRLPVQLLLAQSRHQRLHRLIVPAQLKRQPRRPRCFMCLRCIPHKCPAL